MLVIIADATMVRMEGKPRRRQNLKFALSALLLAAVVFVFLAARPRHKAAFNTIEPGMPKSTVLELLGEPERQLASTDMRSERWEYSADWYGRRQYFIDFDDAGERVNSKRIDDTWFQF